MASFKVFGRDLSTFSINSVDILEYSMLYCSHDDDKAILIRTLRALLKRQVNRDNSRIVYEYRNRPTY